MSQLLNNIDISKIKSKKTYALVDCDSFFASCEVMRNPKLEGKCVCVGGDIIVAATYEAKAYGIKCGTPIWEAKKILGDKGVFLTVDHNFYGEISHKLMKYLGEIANGIAIFSVDEAFLDLTGLDRVYGLSYERLIHKIKIAVKKKIGIPVSIGCSNTKLRAKVFAKVNKPYGTYYNIDEHDINHLFRALPLSDVPFIGKQSGAKLQYMCKNIFDLKDMEYNTVKRYLNGPGTKIWYELNGVDCMKFSHEGLPKGIMRSRSFNPDFISDRDLLMQKLISNFEKAYEELSLLDMKTKHVSIFFRKKDFSKIKIDYPLPSYTNHRKQLIDIIKDLFDKIYIKEILYRSTGITFSELKRSNITQESLFDQTAFQHKELSNIINKINQKMGKHMIGSAANFQKTPIKKQLIEFGEVL